MLQTARKARPVKPPAPMKPPSKTEQLIALLQGDGATVEALAKAMGWQAHTLRARISGLSKPPHVLSVVRERKDGVTLYRIA